MKKAVELLFVSGILMFSIFGFISAGTTIIAGKIYNSDYSATIDGATVKVTCNEHVNETYSKGDGAYSVSFDEKKCSEGNEVFVYAYKKGFGAGEESGEIYNDFPVYDINLGVINVPLVPEFGVLVGGLTILGALGVFFLVRKR